ncbi:BatA domain-containing protein [Roseimaritima ulvae]|uniref:Aerotolerance regulator N-terminal domain-containing protein n=1 Tax=Roseimaritima ulvae TaxID=980254 RepID=A0A5B9R6B0_9BACT|nr:BatA domain-containing protein [Roseimaritima ulvae]QEG41793.1 hypothetical protein UC8_38190 [Roseimaritima ulvae]
MSFLNVSLIIGIAAASIPVLLHLISRREPKRLVFPAVRFLTERIEVNRSRLKIRRWMLLALRAGVLAVLAMALARPQIHQAASGTWLTIGIMIFLGLALLVLAGVATTRQYGRALVLGLLACGLVLMLLALGWGGVVWAGSAPVNVSETAPAAVAIVLDNSPRSDYTTDDGSRLEQMQATAQWLVSRYPRDSRIAVLDRSARPASFSLDNAAAMRTIDKTEPRQLVQPLAERIEAAVRLVRSSELERRAVFVLSDLTRESWTPSDAPSAALSLPPLLAESTPVALQVVNLAAGQDGETADTENRRLGFPAIADATPAREVPVPMSIKVFLEPGTDPAPIRCELQLYELSSSLPVVRDGETVLPPLRVVDRTAGNAHPASPAELFFALPPLLPGTHHGRIQLTGSDPLAIDDVRYFTVTVRPPARVLIVGDDSPAAEHVRRILNAEFEPGDPRAEFAIDSVTPAQFNEQALASLDAVALLDPDPDKLAASAQLALLQWVRDGGNLFIAFGSAGKEHGFPSTSSENTSDARRLLFPTRRVWRIPEGSFFELARPAHPILTELAEIPGGVPWNAFRIQRYWQLDVEPGDAALARYAGTEHAALLERPIGNGRMVMMTTPIVPSAQHRLASWNELFIAADYWPAFLLTRQIFDYVGNRDVGNFNVAVGAPVVVPLDASAPAPAANGSPTNNSRASGTADNTERLQMFTAQMPPVPVPVDQGLAMVGVPHHVGNYWLRGTEPPIGFSANLPEAATELATIDPELLIDILGEGNYELVTDRESIVAAEGRSSEARPLYAQAMIVVLALFLLEQLLANRFYRASKSVTAAAPRLHAKGTT